jgi:hypothetical protein
MENVDKNMNQGMNKDMQEGVNAEQKMAGENTEMNKSFVHDTAGGEMPDPGSVPSKTDFHVDKES